MDRLRSPAWLFCIIALGCQPDIGDPCILPADCSLNGDRLCDTTQPGGYCTEFNCEPGGCPDEAVCVSYRAVVSVAPECSDPQGGERLGRTFCMKSCKRDKDCRTGQGYACVDVTDIEPWAAEVVDRGRVNSRVCTAPYSGVELPLGDGGWSTNVCSPGPPPEFPPPLSAEAGALGPDARPDAPGMRDAQSTLPEAGSDASLEAGPVDAALVDAPGGG